MMLLIAMAITVAWTASMATSLGWFDLEFWWELAALVTIMLLGHWQEMKAIGQAQGALAALAALLPDEAEVVRRRRLDRTVPVGALRVGDVVLVRPGGRVPADGGIVDGEAEVDESMITGESRPVSRAAGRPGRGRHGLDRLGDPRRGSRRSATTPRWPASSGSSPRRRRAGAGPRRSPTGSPRCSSTSRPVPRW